MTKLQTVIGVALLVVLSVIAFELDGIRRNLRPGSSFETILSSLAAAADQLPEPHRRTPQEQKQYENELRQRWEKTHPPKPGATK